MVEIVVNEMWFYHHLVKVLKHIYKCKNYILKILMTNIEALVRESRRAMIYQGIPKDLFKELILKNLR
jgi:hypothetical protein